MPSQDWQQDHSRQRRELQQQQQLEYEQWQKDQLEDFLDTLLSKDNHHDNNGNNVYDYPVPPSTRTDYGKYGSLPPPPPSFTFTVPPPPDDGDDEDITWLVVAILLTALLLLIASLVRSCSQKAGIWLNGGSWNSDSPHLGHGGPGPFGPSGGNNGGGRYHGAGPFQVPEDDDDDQANPSTAQLSENDERLALLTDAQRQAYDSARGKPNTANKPNKNKKKSQWEQPWTQGKEGGKPGTDKTNSIKGRKERAEKGKKGQEGKKEGGWA